MSKKKIKRITRDNFYRPKNKKKYDSPYVFKRFINNFADKRDWGTDKKHFNFYCSKSTKEAVNFNIISSYSRLWNLNLIRIADVEKHLKNENNYIFYTNSQLSHTPLFCIDVDTYDWTCPNDIEKVKNFLLSLHPNCYCQKSTRGKGLHFYILLDLTDYDIDAEYFNDVMKKYSNILKLYINTFFNAKFDAIKATYTKYVYNSEYKKYIIDKCGTLCKLPRPNTYSEYEILYKIPFTTLEQIDSNAIYICTIIDSIINYVLKGGSSGLGSCINIEPIYEYIFKMGFNKGIITSSSSSSSYNHNSLCAQPVQKKKNNNNISEIRNNNDAFQRAKDYYKIFFRQYYREFNIIPDKEICRSEYRKDAGTDEETKTSITRLDSVYDFTLKGFDKNKVNESDYEFGEYTDYIKNNITAADLDLMRKKNTKYRSKIYIYDIDIALGYIFKNLCNKNAKHEKFTLSVVGLEGWYKTIIEQERNKGNSSKITGCNSHKRTALFILVQKLGYAICVDNRYDTGKARKFVLTDKFPKYNEFIKVVGKQDVDSALEAYALMCAVAKKEVA